MCNSVGYNNNLFFNSTINSTMSNCYDSQQSHEDELAQLLNSLTDKSFSNNNHNPTATCEVAAIEKCRQSSIYGPIALSTTASSSSSSSYSSATTTSEATKLCGSNSSSSGFDDMHSSLDNHILQLLASLGHTQKGSSSSPNSAHTNENDNFNLGSSNYVHHIDFGHHNNQTINPAPPLNHYVPPSETTLPSSASNLSTSAAAIATARRYSLLAASGTNCYTRRTSLGISIEDIEKVLNIDTGTADTSTTNNLDQSSSSNHNNNDVLDCNDRTPNTSNVRANVRRGLSSGWGTSSNFTRFESCESLSKLNLSKTLSMHFMDLSNISDTQNASKATNEERGNASFNCSGQQNKGNGMSDANLLLMNLFNSEQNTRPAPQVSLSSSDMQHLARNSYRHISSKGSSRRLFKASSSPFSSSIMQQYHQPSDQATSTKKIHPKEDPFDTQSPFYSASFAQAYQQSLESLLQKMDQSSKSRKGFEEVKRQLHQVERKSQTCHQQLQQHQLHSLSHPDSDYVSNVNNHQSHPFSYADIKATRRRSSKKTNKEVIKKKQYKKHTHRRSLSLKCCTPEMIFGY